MPPVAGGARLASGARKSQSSQASASTGTPDSSKAGAVAPSPTTVDALARALRLDKAEHAHLKALAGTAGRRGFAPETVPPTLGALVERLGQPAYVTGRRWDVLAWNAAADAIFGFGRLLGRRAQHSFVHADPRRGAGAIRGGMGRGGPPQWLAQSRATQDLWAGDPAFCSLSSTR